MFPHKPKTYIVMPAYDASRTLAKTIAGIPPVYEEIILCDDASRDDTSEISRSLGITTIVHPQNRGYGGNQKTLYDAVRTRHPDVVVMVHPDNQYDTSGLPDMIERVTMGPADLVLGTRMATARVDGMPGWKVAGNRLLTAAQNAVFHTGLSEFHSGLRVYRGSLLEDLPYRSFSDDFVFDSEVIAWLVANGRRMDEVSARCYYSPESSSLSFWRSMHYGVATLKTLARFVRGKYRALSVQHYPEPPDHEVCRTL